MAQFTMNATGQSRFAERIRRIAGISPKRENRPGWLIVLLLPLLLALGAWWPSQAENTVSEVPKVEMLNDTLPPRREVKTKTPVQNNAVLPIAPVKVVTEDISGQHESETGQPVSPENVAIEVSKMNVLYIGVDNPLRIAVAGVPAFELDVQLMGVGNITGGNGMYNVRVSMPGEVTLRVSRQSGGKLIWLADQTYRVKTIPDPEPFFGGSRAGTITKEELLTKRNMFAMLVNFDFDAECSILGYEITILPKGQDPITYNVKGAALPENVLSAIEALSGNGDAIFFDSIKAKCSGDTEMRTLNGLVFKLRPKE